MRTPRLSIDGNASAVLAREIGDGDSTLQVNRPLDTANLLSRRPSFIGQKRAERGRPRLRIIILGLSSNYRGLMRELCVRGHDVLFLERDGEWPAANRDLANSPNARTESYASVKELKSRFTSEIREADFVIVGSAVREGIAIGEWITRMARGATAFYDMDTPVTMANLIKGRVDYISSALIPRYQIYLSFTGGPLLNYIEEHYGSPMARPLYRCVDASLFFPEQRETKWDLGYTEAYGDDRQSTLDRLLLEPARRWGEGRFAVAGAQYSRALRWPRNVKRLAHLPPGRHRTFYNSQRFTLNVTGASLVATGFCPSVRLFEAAACGTPIISDFWPGMEMFFKPDEEILISHSADETLIYLEEISELDRRRMGYRARERVLAEHTARHRASELENYVLEIIKPSRD
jgi:spore maturation protein CgeB